MLKNNSGITLVVLIITIVVLLILTSISITISFNGINKILDRNYYRELGEVRQAISEQYEKAVATNNIEKSITEQNVTYFVGERIEDAKKVELPEIEKINANDEVEGLYCDLTEYPNECKFQEDYYYLIETEDLHKIGIYNSKYSFIVNYKTLEVYNITKKTNSNNELLYLPSTIVDESDMVNSEV